MESAKAADEAVLQEEKVIKESWDIFLNINISLVEQRQVLYETDSKGLVGPGQ